MTGNERLLQRRYRRHLRSDTTAVRGFNCAVARCRPVPLAAAVIGLLAMAAAVAAADWGPPVDRVAEYDIEAPVPPIAALRQRFTDEQLAVLEKLNRADVRRLSRLPALVVPRRWVADERAYSPAPLWLASATTTPKVLVVHQPSQFFAAYERGHLVRWGPVSTGAAASATPSGLFHLNWRSPGRSSTVNPRWFMRWYFNFENQLGLSLHAYELPGLPASHGCIRLLERDAEWLFHWGDEWTLSAAGERVQAPGTPLWIVGRYDFTAPPPWRALDSLTNFIELAAPAPDPFAAGMSGNVCSTTT